MIYEQRIYQCIPGKLPALIHCSSGKDRTGMLVAVALKLAGVSDDDVVADFALSADNLRFFAGAARMLEGKSAGEYVPNFTSYIRREPIGVCAPSTAP